MQKAQKQGEPSASMKPHNQHSQPQRKPNQTHLLTQNRNPELGSDSHQDRLRPNSTTPCYTPLVPFLTLEGEAVQRKGNSSPGLMAQPPVRGGQSLPPKRSCSQTHLDSSPVASTPKCSHTAGQNCSLQVMKSSSRLARAEERVNNPAPFPEQPPEIPMVLLPSLWEKAFALDPGTFGTSRGPQITRKASAQH